MTLCVKPGATRESGTADDDVEMVLEDLFSAESTIRTASVDNQTVKPVLGVYSLSPTAGGDGGSPHMVLDESSGVVIKPSTGGIGITTEEDMGGTQKSGINHEL